MGERDLVPSFFQDTPPRLLATLRDWIWIHWIQVEVDTENIQWNATNQSDASIFLRHSCSPDRDQL